MRLISCALLLLALGCTAGRALAGPAPFCGTSASPPDSWEHVVWIWFENHGYDEIVGSAAAPFINRTLIAGCGLATNAHNETHPSLPNYIAATSGLPPGRLGRWATDCNATAGCLTRAPSLFGQAASWGAYAESMPKPCVHWFTGPYAASHNPAVYYRALADCPLHDVPYGAAAAGPRRGHPARVRLRHPEHVPRHAQLSGRDRRRVARPRDAGAGRERRVPARDDGHLRHRRRGRARPQRSLHVQHAATLGVTSPSSSSRRRRRPARGRMRCSTTTRSCEPPRRCWGSRTIWGERRNAHSMRAAFNL